jgi:D-alanine-D-alanine ligase
LIPVYVAPSGHWYSGDCLFDRNIYRSFNAEALVHSEALREVTIRPHPHANGLVECASGKEVPVDVCFLAFHGEYGEDGCIQGLLELAGIPYTGCRMTASAVAMHKAHCKAILSSYGIPVLPWMTVQRVDAQKSLSSVLEGIVSSKQLGEFPLFVKPVKLGSSVGVRAVKDVDELASALAQVFVYDSEAIIEPCISNLIEINISCLEGDGLQGEKTHLSVVEIPVADDGVLSYEDKYLRQGNKTGDCSGMASLTRIIDPDDLDPNIKQQVIEYARRAFEILDCGGVVRFDFLYDLDAKALYFNELNPLPGSLSYYLWEQTPHNGQPHLLYTELLDKMIEAAIRRHKQKISLDRSIGFHALQSC